MHDALSRYVQRIGRTRTFARVGSKVFHRLDRIVFKATKGRYIVSDAMLPVVMLTTTGRRSGRPRTVPIAAFPDDGDWLVVGSNFGQGHHPAWALNLLADPRAVVQRRGRRHEVTAEVLDDDTRAAIWPRLTAYWPPFDDYVDRAGSAGREIRVFRLRPVGPEAGEGGRG